MVFEGTGDGDSGGPDVLDRSDAATALLAGAAGVAGSYAAAGLTTGFLVAPVESLLTRLVPGAVVTAAILVLGGLGQQLNFALAGAITVLALAALVYVARRVTREAGGTVAPVVLPAVGGFGLAVLLTGTVVPSLAVALAVALVLAIGDGVGALAEGRVPEALPLGVERRDRRRVLGTLAGAVGTGVVGTVVGARFQPGDDPGPGSGSPDGPVTLVGVDADRIQGLIADADGKDLDLEGMDGLVSRSFYEVDIDAVNPTVRTDDWTLSFTGDVGNEFELAYEDLRGMDATHRPETLRCVGEQLNGHKMDTAVWTGVPAAGLIERAAPEGQYVVLRAADGYWEEFPLDAFRSGLIAYGMNGTPLPRRHGYPVRALVPGHWGEINVKWLTEVEFSDEPVTGYWEKRGWHGTGPVKTVAKIHATNVSGGRVEVGGHTYAGTRGIRTVEVSTDGGDTWTEADLSAELPGPDTWRQWVHRYDHPGNPHEVVARAIDGTGTVQPEQYQSPYPSGPEGWVSKRVE